MARLLAISDEEDDLLCARLAVGCTGDFGRVEVVVSCGDLRPGYLDFVATLANAPLAYVRGNHDTEQSGFEHVGGIALDMRVVSVGGLRLAGLDGSLAYREGIVGYTEAQMRRRAVLLAARAKLAGGVDVLVTHAPPRGYGDMEDAPHRGFSCFNWLLDVLRPRVMLCGHVHLSYGMVRRERVHPSGTRIVNACGYWEGTLCAKGDSPQWLDTV